MMTTKNRWLRLALPVMLVAAIGVGCNDDDDENGTTGPTIADLAGNWNATSAVLTHPAITVDAVQTLGATITLEITTQERFTLVVDLPGEAPETFTGDFTISGNNVTITTDDDPTNPLTGTFTLSSDGNTLTVSIGDVELLDITMDGVVDEADQADLDATFTRTS